MKKQSKYMKLLIFIALFISFFPLVKAQELNCSVMVATPGIEGTNKQIYETMQKSIFEFMNTRKWTNYNFKMEERIDCSILITINSVPSSDEFQASIQVQSRRPIFSSSYNSSVINLNDKNVKFRYVEFQSLDFSESAYSSELTSLLAYYAYIIIGLDFDTFSTAGGTVFFEKAQTIVNSAQSSAYPGWKAYEDLKNRYWLVENLLNKSFNPVRKFLYSYYKEGLDVMYSNNETARNQIASALEFLQIANRDKPNSYLIQLMVSAKSDEIVNIFSQGTPMDKTKVVNIMNELDPANSSKYKKILENKF
jgi:hypothetical protein